MTLFNPLPLLRNPRFATPGGFVIRRKTVTVDDDGIATQTHEDIPAQGAVIPSGNLGMKVTPESEQQGSGITIFSDQVMTLGNADSGTVADLVLWHGQLYQVTKQDDWSDFGFNVAQAELVDAGGRSAS